MNPGILKLHPTEFYCPHCGEWHTLPNKVELGSLDLTLRCEHHPNFDNSFKVFFHGEKICSYIITPCHKFGFYMYPYKGSVNISQFKEVFYGFTPSIELPIVLALQSKHPSEEICNNCNCYKHCEFFSNEKYIDEHFFETKIAFRFNPDEYANYVKNQAVGIVKNAWGAVTDVASEAYKKATSEDTCKKASSFAEGAYEKVSKFAGEAYKKVSEFADKAIERASEFTEEACDKVSDFAEEACEKVADFFDKNDDDDDFDDEHDYESDGKPDDEHDCESDGKSDGEHNHESDGKSDGEHDHESDCKPDGEHEEKSDYDFDYNDDDNYSHMFRQFDD